MADTTKIMLSLEELEVVRDSSWVLTKREIISKVCELFNQQVPAIAPLFNAVRPMLSTAVLAARPKISRGENYKHLPYVILDYPALFAKGDIFALRTMFWWGNFFSITLHLGGSYKNLYQETLLQGMYHEDDAAQYICVNTQPWEHHFEPDNYVLTTSLDKQHIKDRLTANDFLKIAYKFDLKEWNQIQGLLSEGYAKIAKGLGV